MMESQGLTVGWIVKYRRLVPALLAAALVATCQAGGGEASGSPSASPGPTSGEASAGAGHVIHVNLYVPLTSDTPIGSVCDAAALHATGPVAATIPGSRLTFLRFVDDVLFQSPQQPPTPPGTDGSAQMASPTVFEPGPQPTIGRQTIGEQLVPLSGTVIGPVSTDEHFPTACLFSFDVPTTTDVDRYAFSLGRVYIPVPIIIGSQLEAAGWVANIGVNPQ